MWLDYANACAFSTIPTVADWADRLDGTMPRHGFVSHSLTEATVCDRTTDGVQLATAPSEPGPGQFRPDFILKLRSPSTGLLVQSHFESAVRSNEHVVNSKERLHPEEGLETQGEDGVHNLQVSRIRRTSGVHQSVRRGYGSMREGRQSAFVSI